MFDEKQANEYRAYFIIVGDFSPGDISKTLGIRPSRSWAKGDLNSETGVEIALSRWSLDSRLSPTEYIDKHVLDVLEQLSPVSDLIPKLVSRYDAWIQLVAYFLNAQASVNLSANIIETLSKLKLGLDFDPYDLLANEEGV